MGNKTFIIILAAVGAVIVFGIIRVNTISVKTLPEKEISQEIGARKKPVLKPAPEFSLKDMNGEERKLSDFRNKAVIITFWATWCPPCRAEIPHFKSLYEEYKEKGLEVVGIALDQGGVKDVKPFAEKNKITYPILLANQKVVEDYGGIRGIPTTFVIDRKGNIIEKFIGYRDKEVFEAAIKKLL